MTVSSPKYNIIDLLVTDSSETPFVEQLTALNLSKGLENKCLEALNVMHADDVAGRRLYLTRSDEGELATEVLLYRHRFTQLVAEHTPFRQAALSIIQNIYLSRERRIFFSSTASTAEQERQEALLLFSRPAGNISIPLGKTFQHMILARVWHRIVYKSAGSFDQDAEFIELRRVVENLNTLRNIYMLLTTGLVRKLTAGLSKTYKQSITREDAYQIGSFGVARAAYRYHPSSGSRFSTYASFWILREVQRQALGGRLIRVPATLLEQISRGVRKGDKEEEAAAVEALGRATVALGAQEDLHAMREDQDPGCIVEHKELHLRLHAAVDRILSPKSADILRRRYGLGPYQGNPQSVIEISLKYGVTRGSIYQLEAKAMEKLRKHLAPAME